MDMQNEQRKTEPWKPNKKVYNKSLNPEQSYLRNIFNIQRCDANPKHRNIEWKLTFEEWSNIIQQDCYFCGSKPMLKEGKMHTRVGIQVPINSIDRIDSSNGYILNNVRCCCTQCNYMKNRMDDNMFLTHVKKIWSHNFANI
jgi:hypothetical protein